LWFSILIPYLLILPQGQSAVPTEPAFSLNLRADRVNGPRQLIA